MLGLILNINLSRVFFFPFFARKVQKRQLDMSPKYKVEIVTDGRQAVSFHQGPISERKVALKM